MGGNIIVVVLVCSRSLAVPDCSIDTATDVIYGPRANSVLECGFSGQALIASTALGPELSKDQYLKVVCADRDHFPRTNTATWAQPSAQTNVTRELP
jgi:hypothetical protein